MIGYLGDIIFETNDKKILTFSGLNQTISGSWSEHKRQGKKSKWEFNGPVSQKITFSMVLNASYGVNPRKMLKKLTKYVESGIVSVLVIGGKKVGYRWRITNISATWDEVMNRGELVKASLNVTVEEYA